MDRLLAGRYRLLDRLGAGGMSVVWRAHDEVLGRDVAVKVLSPAGPATNSDLLDRLRVEARSAARLHHPNVVEVFDYGETEAHEPYVVLELVDGRSLSDVLADGPLPWQTAVRVCAQVAAALAAAHAEGVVHRDIKPSNVMVTTGGVKLVDFGISATVGEADGIGGEVFGTPAYLAPERLRGGMVRPATDVYALGLLLYLALAGRMPWTASTTTQMLKAHRYLEPGDLPHIPGLPGDIADLVRRCLAKEPGRRPSAAAAARTLADITGEVPVRPLLATPTVPITTPARRRRLLVAAGVVALLPMVAGVVWLGGRGGPDAAEALPQTPVAQTCTVGYSIRSAADGKVATEVAIDGTAATAWSLTFALPAGQDLVKGWHPGWTQDGRSVRVTGTGLPLETGFDASYTDATTLPSRFELNGTVCAAEMSVAGSTTPPTTAAPAKAAATSAPGAKPPAAKAPAPKAKEPAAKAKTKAKAKAPKAKDNSGKGDSDDDEDEGDDD